MTKKIIFLVAIFLVITSFIYAKQETIRINYHRFDENYQGWGLHVWGDGYVGQPVAWQAPMQPAGKTDYGIYWDIPYDGKGQVSFIIHKGDKKDPDMDRTYPKPWKNKQIWTITQDAKEYTTLKEAKKNMENKIEKALIIDANTIEARFVKPIEERIKIISAGEEIPIEKVKTRGETTYIITISETIKPNVGYEVVSGNTQKRASLTWELIDAKFKYDGKLGCFYTPEETEFKLWAPLASQIKLNIYENWNDKKLAEIYSMKKSDRGVWRKDLKGDHKHKYYTYTVTNYGESREILDPYAKGMGAFTNERKRQVGKGAILAPDEIGPELEFVQIEDYNQREDAIIWEIHVRDFTSDPDLKTDAQFGTYKSFIEKLDYIKSLGVTHVQLLPVMSYYFGNELENDIRELEWSAQNNNYNWGYDPHNYFTPEGMYSQDPTDPSLRIAELKQLIKAIHKRGMGVILDCVYNHTARMWIFEDIVPNYYHFMDEKGNPKGSYGGGRLGSTHAMTRKLIINSVTYWVDEYKVDGFRFDLMGDLDAETVQMAYDKAKKINPDILFVGEGWRTYTGDFGDTRVAADQDWMNQTDAAACFSDEMRNILKSGFGSEGQPKFITGGAQDIKKIFQNIKGNPANIKNDKPGDVVQYIAAHDNLTLHDVIAVSVDKDPSTPEGELEIQKRIRLGNAIIFTSQGIAFLHAGQEYGRSKQWLAAHKPQANFQHNPGFKYPYFIDNSYDASDIINKIDWDKISEPGIHKETMEFTKGLIKIRKSTDAFRLGNRELIDSNVTLIETDDIYSNDVAIAYRCQSTDGAGYYIFVNGDDRERKIETEFNLMDKDIIVDTNKAGIVPINKPSGVQFDTNNSITIDPLTVIIFRD
ncbi:MAG: pullulanase [Candidatus Cloacimonetes bacterium]|nr:pullulanase [Candidatus Cloacimonadota bacterium]